MTDRNIDGRYDCTADRPGNIFADYTTGSSGVPLNADEDSSTGKKEEVDTVPASYASAFYAVS